MITGNQITPKSSLALLCHFFAIYFPGVNYFLISFFAFFQSGYCDSSPKTHAMTISYTFIHYGTFRDLRTSLESGREPTGVTQRGHTDSNHIPALTFSPMLTKISVC